MKEANGESRGRGKESCFGDDKGTNEPGPKDTFLPLLEGGRLQLAVTASVHGPP